MRYDRLLNRIDVLRTKYESGVRQLLAQAAREDAATTEAILNKGKAKRKSPRLHWTQRPENKARLKRILKAATKKREAKRRGSKN